MNKQTSTAYSVVFRNEDGSLRGTIPGSTPECAIRAANALEGQEVFGFASIRVEPEPISGMRFVLREVGPKAEPVVLARLSDADHWCSPDDLPPVEPGQQAWFWVAVRRADGRVRSFPAAYLNAMLLCDEWGNVDARTGNRYHYSEADEDDGSFAATGWHDAREHGEYENLFTPLLAEGDELLAWRAVAPYEGTHHG